MVSASEMNSNRKINKYAAVSLSYLGKLHLHIIDAYL